jgi:hypothetical protein
MTPSRPRTRELAERASNGTQVRLLWRQGTRRVWVEVLEPETDRALRIHVRPEHALDAFQHPYAYAGTHGLLSLTESPDIRDLRPHAADGEVREQ